MVCKDCKLFDLDATKNKAGHILKARGARCLWVSKEQWPLSVNERFSARPKTGYMLPEDGPGCKCFQKRVK